MLNFLTQAAVVPSKNRRSSIPCHPPFSSLRVGHLAGLLALTLLVACQGGDPSKSDKIGLGEDEPSNALVAARPYEKRVPQSYDPQKRTPLVVLLHGFGANGITQSLYFGLGDILDREGFLYAYPDGTTNSAGKQFWNATELCCDFENTAVDDVAYIAAVIADMKAHYNVDPGRVYLIGHSNGGFMSHRFACDRADLVAGIVSLAGATWKDPGRCQPKEPVAVLQVHGDQDDAVPYGGAMRGGLMLPSAEETVASWAGKNGCQAGLDKSPPSLDLEANLDGAETTVARHPGCRSGSAAELWTIKGGGHTPSFLRPGWAQAIWGFLKAHSKSAQ